MRCNKLFRSFILGLSVVIALIYMGSAVPVHAAENEVISGKIEVSANVGEEEMKKYIEDFEKKYPLVTVEYHYYEDYENAIRQRLPSGTYGDVLFMPGFVKDSEYARYFAPLGDYLELSHKYNYMESSKHSGLVVYGIPSSAYMAGILYNKDVFYQAGISDIPKSIDEFYADLKDIKDRTDAIPFYTNYSDSWVLTFWEHFPYIEMTGNPDYRDIEFANEYNPFLAGSTHYQVYKLLYDIVQNKLCESNPMMSNWNQSKKMLNQGKIGCMAIGSWALSQVKEAGPNGDSVAFMPFPNEIDGKQYMTVSTDYCYAVNKNSQNIEAAKAYISFMLDESGYALDHETLSLVRTDPYPDSYGNMDNVILLSNSPATSESYQKKQKLSAKINLETDMDEIKRVIEAACGTRNEDFDQIAKDWNNRWESSRTPNMTVTERSRKVIENSIISDDYKVDFSQTEIEYLGKTKSIKVGYLKEEAPFQYENEDGFTGLASGICSLIEENTGLAIEYLPFMNTEQLLKALRDGTIEMIAGINQDTGYGDDIKYSKEYLSSMGVVVKNDTADISDAQNSRLAGIRGESNSYKAIECSKVYDNISDAIRAVENLEADYVVTNYYSADYYIREQGCSHVTITPLSDMVKLSLAFSSDVDTRLVSICNKCIYGMQQENIQIMLREYMEPPLQEVTLARFVEANPFECLVALCIIFIIVVAGIIIIMKEKYKSATKHALDMKRYEILATMVNEYIFEYDINTNTVRFDQKFEEKFNYGKQIDLNSYQNDNEELKTAIRNYHQMKENSQEASEEFQITDKYGEKQWYRLLAHTVYDNNGKQTSVLGKLMNVQKEVEERLAIADRAQRDPLTGLYNRKGFIDHFEQMQNSLTDEKAITFAVLDFDSFKNVNDLLGHAGGDEALLMLSAKLQEIFNDKTIIARYGGDEFMLYADGIEEDKIREMFSTLVREMDTDFTYQGITGHISISLGAVYTTSGLPFTVLFKEADKVLYKTKKEGKNNYRLIHHLDEI